MKTTVEELKKNIEAKNITILDVRREADYINDTSKIKGAIWHDPSKIDEWIDAMPKDKEIVFYCVKGGSVSKLVSEKMLEKGLNARYIEGGIEAWKNSGGETEKR